MGTTLITLTNTRHARLKVLTARLLKIRVLCKFPASDLTVPGQTMRTVGEVALRQGFLRLLRFTRVFIIPHTHQNSFRHHRLCI